MTLRNLFPILLFCFAATPAFSEETVRPNILIVTVDDMNCDSVGAFGCKLGRHHYPTLIAWRLRGSVINTLMFKLEIAILLAM